MSDSYVLYSTACRILAVAFGIVALGLLFVPSVLTGSMEFIAGLLGASGDITVGTGDLDHVLSVSLMACIVALAVGSARHPEQLVPYVSLLTAKVVSTVGFAYLALMGNGAWTLGAIADGSVIVVLVVARSFASPTSSEAS